MPKIKSTLAFIFTPDYQQVLLIRKNKPEFHKGKLNGLGGKCEQGESALQCVSREVKEEAGLVVPTEHWKHVTVLTWQEWVVDVFAVVYQGSLKDVQSEDGQEITWFSVKELPETVLSNLPWLIPLSIDVLTNPQPPEILAVNYSP